LSELKRIVGKIKIPVVAIGGINKGNIQKIFGLGCDRIAVIRAAGELTGDRARLWHGR
jgi:thiamine monophosphate synthase